MFSCFVTKVSVSLSLPRLLKLRLPWLSIFSLYTGLQHVKLKASLDSMFHFTLACSISRLWCVERIKKTMSL